MPIRVKSGDAHQHVAHVADAGIADDVFQVLLGHGGHRAVEHVDRSKGYQDRHPVFGSLRQAEKCPRG